MAHVLVVVSRRYNGAEFWPAVKTLHKRGHTFDIVSTGLRIADERTMKANTIKKLVTDVEHFEGYDGLAVISGNPEDTEGYWHNKHMQRLVSEAATKQVVIGAVCMAVPTIRLALKGKRASFFPVIRARLLLEEAGAILQTVSLSTDTNTVTSENEAVTNMWITNYCDLLEHQQPTYILHESPFKRNRGQRMPVPALEHIKEVIRNSGKDKLNGKA